MTSWSLADLISYSARGSWRPNRLADIVSTHARRDPRRAAVIDDRGRISYGELDAAADAAALGFLELGLRPGDVVGIKLPNWHEAAVALLAAERVGAVVSPLALTAGAHELGGMLSASGCRLLVVAGSHRGRDHAAEAAQLLREHGQECAIVVVGDGSTVAGTPWADLLAPGDRGLGPTALASLFGQLTSATAGVSHLSFSSGSTGVPRGILHTHNSLLSTVGDYITLQRFGRDDVFHVPLPVGYSGGFVYGVRLALQAGGTALLQEKWNPAEAVELIRDHKAAYSTGTPTHVMDVVGLGRIGDLASLRVYNCGGAHAPTHVIEAAIESLGTVYCRSYGMTECHRLATTDAGTPLELLRGTDGRLQPGMVMRVVDEEGRELPPGTEGLVHVKGPYLFSGYLDPTAENRLADGGFFDTGDTGFVTENGYVTITGRVKDIIVRGGAKIPAAAVESVMVEHPDVQVVALVPVPDDRLGELAAACVVLKPGRSMVLEDMIAHLAARGVTKQHWPSSLHIFDTLPQTPTGKVRKAQLAETLRTHHQPSQRTP